MKTIYFDQLEEYLYIATDYPGGIWRWEIESGKLHTVLRQRRKATEKLFVNSGGAHAVLINREEVIRVWDSSNQEHPIDLAIHPSIPSNIAFSSDGIHMAAGGNNAKVLIWEIKSDKPPVKLNHSGPIEALTFNSAGNRLTTCSQDGTARIWDISTGSEVQRFEHPGKVKLVAFSNSGKKLATADSDKVMRVWDIDSASEVVKAPHEGKLNSIAFNSSDAMVASACKDNTARVWDVASGRELFRIVQNNEVEKAIFIPYSNLLATASRDSTVGVWSLDSWRQVIMNLSHDDNIIGMALDYSGERIVTASSDNIVRVWDMQTGQEAARFIQDTGVQAITISHSGDSVAIGNEDDIMRVLNVSNGNERQYIDLRAEANIVAFNPKGNLLATGGNKTQNYLGEELGTELQIWKLNDGKRIAQLAHEYEVVGAVFSSSGDQLVSADLHSIKTWAVLEGRKIASIDVKSGIRSMVLNTAENQVATANWDGTVRVFDLNSSKEVILFAHEDLVNSVAFSFKGDAIATGGKDGVVRIWDLTTGKEIVRLSHGTEITAVAFQPRTDQLITVGGKEAIIWTWRFETLIDEVCSRIPRNLTREEWRDYMGDEPYQQTCSNLPGDTYISRVNNFISQSINLIRYGHNTIDPGYIR
jgi:WD40 repeat protein